MKKKLCYYLTFTLTKPHCNCPDFSATAGLCSSSYQSVRGMSSFCCPCASRDAVNLTPGENSHFLPERRGSGLRMHPVVLSPVLGWSTSRAPWGSPKRRKGANGAWTCPPPAAENLQQNEWCECWEIETICFIFWEWIFISFCLFSFFFFFKARNSIYLFICF